MNVKVGGMLVEHLEGDNYTQYYRKRRKYKLEHASLSPRHRAIREYKMRQLFIKDPAAAHAILLYGAGRIEQAREIIKSRNTGFLVKVISGIDAQIQGGMGALFSAKLGGVKSYKKKDGKHLMTKTETVQQRHTGGELGGIVGGKRYTSEGSWSSMKQKGGVLSGSVEANAHAGITGTVGLPESIMGVYYAIDDKAQKQYRIDIQLEGGMEAMLMGMKEIGDDPEFLKSIAGVGEENIYTFQDDENAEASFLDSSQLEEIEKRKIVDKKEREILEDPSKKGTEEYEAVFEKVLGKFQKEISKLQIKPEVESQTPEEYIQGQIKAYGDFLAQYGTPDVRFRETQENYDDEIKRIQNDIKKAENSPEEKQKFENQLEEIEGGKFLHQVSYYETNARAVIDSFALFVGFFDSKAAAEISKIGNSVINIGAGAARLYGGDFTALPQLLGGLGSIFSGSSGPSPDEIMIGMLNSVLKNQQTIINLLIDISVDLGELRKEVSDLAIAFRKFESGNKESLENVQSSLRRIEEGVYLTMDMVQRVETYDIYREIDQYKRAITFMFEDALQRSDGEAMVKHITEPEKYYNYGLAKVLGDSRSELMSIAMSDSHDNQGLDYGLDFDIEGWEQFDYHVTQLSMDRRVAALDTIGGRFHISSLDKIGNPLIAETAGIAYIDIMRYLPTFGRPDDQIYALLNLTEKYRQHNQDALILLARVVHDLGNDIGDILRIYYERKIEILDGALFDLYVNLYVERLHPRDAAYVKRDSKYVDKVKQDLKTKIGEDDKRLDATFDAVDANAILAEIVKLPHKQVKAIWEKDQWKVEKIIGVIKVLGIILEDIKKRRPNELFSGEYVDTIPGDIIDKIISDGSHEYRITQGARLNQDREYVTIDRGFESGRELRDRLHRESMEPPEPQYKFIDNHTTGNLYQDEIKSLSERFPDNEEIKNELTTIQGKGSSVFHIELEGRNFTALGEGFTDGGIQPTITKVTRTDGSGNIIFQFVLERKEIERDVRDVVKTYMAESIQKLQAREGMMKEMGDDIHAYAFGQSSAIGVLESLAAFEMMSSLILKGTPSNESEKSIQEARAKSIHYDHAGNLQSPFKMLLDLITSASTLDENSGELDDVITILWEIRNILKKINIAEINSENSSILLTKLESKIKVLQITRPDLIDLYEDE